MMKGSSVSLLVSLLLENLDELMKNQLAVLIPAVLPGLPPTALPKRSQVDGGTAD